VEEYPGYFANRPPFLRRRWVQLVGTGFAGLLIGALLTGSGSEASTPSGIPEAQVQARINAAVQEAVDSEQAAAESEQASVESEQAAAESQFADAVEDLKHAQGQLKSLKRELTDARAEVRQVKRAARASQRQAVAAAVSRTKTQMRKQAATAQPRSSTGGGSSTDPRFSYCYEANDAGYGNYQRGVDPEYDWYRDADNDGWVCEF